MENQEMKLRGGATDSGRAYEYKMAALLGIRLAFDKSLQDFWIVSNINGVGDFDDVVIMMEDQSGARNMFCVQLKHIKNEDLDVRSMEGLVKKKFKGTDKNFYLKKYQESFDSIKENIDKLDIFEDISIEQLNLILYTNACLTGQGVSISCQPCNPMSFLNTSFGNKGFFKISNKPESTDPISEEFLSCLYLYSSQTKADNLDSLIKHEICSRFPDVGNTDIVSVTDFFAKWATGKKGKILRLHKQDIQLKLLEMLYYPHIMSPYGYIGKDNEVVDILNSALLYFNVTQISRKNLVNYVLGMLKLVLQRLFVIEVDLTTSWDMNLNQEQLDRIYGNKDSIEEKLLGTLKTRQQFVPHLSLKDLYWAAWSCGYLPLVVDCDLYQNKISQALNEFFELCGKFSFVLFSTVDLVVNENLRVFNSFTEIEDPDIIARSLKSLTVSLQGKDKIKLEQFKNEIVVLKEITSEIFILLLCESLVIGESYEVENYYIKRNFVKPLLDMNVLDKKNLAKEKKRQHTHSGDLFVVVNENYQVPIWHQSGKIDLDSYLENIEVMMGRNDVYILVTDEGFYDIINKVQKLYLTRKSIHFVSVINATSLQWLQTVGSIEILEEFVLESDVENINIPVFSEDGLQEVLNKKANIISDNAGMGKSFILRSIANKYNPDEWVVCVNLNDHFSEITKHTQSLDLPKHLVNFQMKQNDILVHNFCTKIFKYCLKQSKMIWLFDGYDQVASLETLTVLLQAKQNRTVRLWIATRPVAKVEIEKVFDTLSMELANFSDDNQKLFLRQYFEYKSEIYNYNSEQIENAIEQIQTYSAVLDKTLAGIPLQSRMLAEILGDDINKINNNKAFTVVDLYDIFIDVKLKEYKLYEATSLRRTLAKLALKLFYEESYIENVIDMDELNEDAIAFKHSYKKDSIVAGINHNGDAVFGHRTFAEYLAAQFLVKKFVDGKMKNDNKNIFKKLVEKTFYKELQPLRVFFDRILTRKLPLHTAVLSNDYNNVKQLLNADEQLQADYTNATDHFGRSALQLAVSHGKFYDLFETPKIHGIRNKGLHPDVSVHNAQQFRFRIPIVKKYQVGKDIVQLLSQYKFTNTKDNLFNYDLFEYALQSCSLENLNILYKTFSKDNLTFYEDFSFPLFLYCVAYANLYNLLSNLTEPISDNSVVTIRDIFQQHMDLFKIKYNDNFLTEVAAGQNSKEIIFVLLKTGLLQLTDGYPLHKTCANGHVETLQFLFEIGAKINSCDEEGLPPILFSGKQGRSDVTYKILKNDDFIRKTDKLSSTPLHYACQGGHLKCTSLLIKLGADVNQVDRFGKTPIYYSALYGFGDITKELLTKQIPVEVLQEALEVAISNNYPECSKYLVDAGLNINNQNAEGKTVLMLACIEGSSTTTELLVNLDSCDSNILNELETFYTLRHWAQGHHHVQFSMKTFALHTKAQRETAGVAAIHYAVRHGHLPCVKALVNFGADYKIKDNIPNFNYTPLVWASLYGKADITKFLLTFQHDVEDEEFALFWASILGYQKIVKHLLDNRDHWKESKINYELNESLKIIIAAEFTYELRLVKHTDNMPLLLAAKNGQANIVQELLLRNFRDNEGIDQALLWAAREGHHQCIDIFLEAGANRYSSNHVIGLHYMPIVWACMYGRIEVVRCFLKTEPKESLDNKEFHFALNWAALGGHQKIVRMLLDFGLNVNSIDDRLQDNSPLMSACEERGTLETVDELISHGCDVNIRNKNNTTALDFAVRGEKWDIAAKIILASSFVCYGIEISSPLYENFQNFLRWAIENEKPDILYKLVEMGISKS